MEILADEKSEDSRSDEDTAELETSFFWENWKKFLFPCDEDSTTREKEFDDDLGDDSSQEVSFWDEEDSDDNSDDDSCEIDIEEDILFVGSYEKVIEDLFDKAEDQDDSQEG